MITTLRKELNKLDFNWKEGVIIYQYNPEDINDINLLQTDPRITTLIYNKGIEYEKICILDKEFDNNESLPECPIFIAEDKENVYIPAKYDGTNWLEVIKKDIFFYLKNNALIPYVGG